MKSRFLKLEIIWKDDDMFELQISVDNGRYSGRTEVYETKDSLLQFAKSLEGFPNDKENLTHRCGEKDSYAYFEMKFYQIGLTGIVGLQISLEENVATEYREEEKDKLKMELVVEPNAIDKFQKELVELAKTEKGVAELIGIEKHTNSIN
jgi:hypothetical protein